MLLPGVCCGPALSTSPQLPNHLSWCLALCPRLLPAEDKGEVDDAHSHPTLGRTWEKLNAFAAGFESRGNTVRHLIFQWILDREVVYCCLGKRPLRCCSWAWYFLQNQDLRVFSNEKEHISKHEVSTPDPYVTSFQSGLLYAGTVGLVYLPSCVLLPSS